VRALSFEQDLRNLKNVNQAGAMVDLSAIDDEELDQGRSPKKTRSNRYRTDSLMSGGISSPRGGPRSRRNSIEDIVLGFNLSPDQKLLKAGLGKIRLILAWKLRGDLGLRLQIWRSAVAGEQQADLVAKLEEMREEELMEVQAEHTEELKQITLESDKLRSELEELREEHKEIQERLIDRDAAAAADSSDESASSRASTGVRVGDFKISSDFIRPQTWFGQKRKESPETLAPPIHVVAARKSGEEEDGLELVLAQREIKSLQEVRDMLGLAITAKDERICELGKEARERDIKLEKLESDLSSFKTKLTDQKELMAYLKADYEVKEALILTLTLTLTLTLIMRSKRL